MISHEHRCIFIHIPKCAGTSIERAFGHLDGHEGRRGQDHRSIRMIERPMLTPRLFSSADNGFEVMRRVRHRLHRARNPRNKRRVSSEQYRSYFKFTFVRNPWARAYSWYRNVLRDVNHLDTMGISGPIPLGEFLERFAGRGELRPQTYWIRDFGGAIPLDFIGRFENLREDFGEVCRFIGCDRISLPHEVRGSGEDYREHFDTESIELVRDVYRNEIELFGYSFE